MSNTQRRVEANRLLYLGDGETPEAWDAQWAKYDTGRVYVDADEGRLGWVQEFVDKYLSPGCKVLEAGCGMGQHVVALLHRGYAAEGLEWGAQTVSRVHQVRPKLPISVGDVASIERPDNHYDGYISLGVVEHTRDGPERYLKEAFRVLVPGGIALISVPCFHWLRRIKAGLGMYQADNADMSFYQYAFRRNEFKKLVESAGFETIEIRQYDSYKGILDEVSALRWVMKRRLGKYDLGSVMQKLLRRVGVIENSLGHMVMFVVKKPKIPSL